MSNYSGLPLWIPMTMTLDGLSSLVGGISKIIIWASSRLQITPDELRRSAIYMCRLSQMSYFASSPSEQSTLFATICFKLEYYHYPKTLQTLAALISATLLCLFFYLISSCGFWLEAWVAKPSKNLMTWSARKAIAIPLRIVRIWKNEQYYNDRMENFRAGRRLSDPTPRTRRMEQARLIEEYQSSIKAHAYKKPYHPIKNPYGWGAWYHSTLFNLALIGMILWLRDGLQAQLYVPIPIAAASLLVWSTIDAGSFWTWSLRAGFFWQQIAASVSIATIFIGLRTNIFLRFIITSVTVLVVMIICRIIIPNHVARFWLRARVHKWVILSFNILIYIIAALIYLPVTKSLPYVAAVVFSPGFVGNWLFSIAKFGHKSSLGGWIGIAMNVFSILAVNYISWYYIVGLHFGGLICPEGWYQRLSEAILNSLKQWIQSNERPIWKTTRKEPVETIAKAPGIERSKNHDPKPEKIPESRGRSVTRESGKTPLPKGDAKETTKPKGLEKKLR